MRASSPTIGTQRSSFIADSGKNAGSQSDDNEPTTSSISIYFPQEAQTLNQNSEDNETFTTEFKKYYEPGCFGGRVGRLLDSNKPFNQAVAEKLAKDNPYSATAIALKKLLNARNMEKATSTITEKITEIKKALKKQSTIEHVKTNYSYKSEYCQEILSDAHTTLNDCPTEQEEAQIKHAFILAFKIVQDLVNETSVKTAEEYAEYYPNKYLNRLDSFLVLDDKGIGIFSKILDKYLNKIVFICTHTKTHAAEKATNYTNSIQILHWEIRSYRKPRDNTPSSGDVSSAVGNGALIVLEVVVGVLAGLLLG